MQLLTGLQLDICNVIETRLGFEIAENTRFYNYFKAAIHLLFKIVINLKTLDNSQSTSIVKLYVYKTVKREVINVEFLSKDLPLNKSAVMVIFIERNV